MFEADLPLLLLRIVLQKLELVLLEGVSIKGAFFCDFTLEDLCEHGDMLGLLHDIVE